MLPTPFQGFMARSACPVALALIPGEQGAKVLYALLLVKKPRGFPHHFAGVVVAGGISLLPDLRFEFWGQGRIHRKIASRPYSNV
jgi:hypothetical protein